MSYATVNDLRDTLPPRDLQLLTDHDGAADEIDDSKLTAALRDATAEINGYIAKAVDLPLAEPPDMLRVVCRDLAVYRLYANVSRVTETQEKLRKAAISYLEMVGEGKVSIGDGTGGNEVQTSEGAVTVEGPERVMSRDALKGF